MRAIWTMARLDLAVWRRSPWAIAAAVIPPLGMLVLVKVLTLAVTVQPVALVIEDHGPQSFIVAEFIADDTESYQLRVTDRARAERLLEKQKVVAVVDIPKGFHAAAARGHAVLPYTLNKRRHRRRRRHPEIPRHDGGGVRRAAVRNELRR